MAAVTKNDIPDIARFMPEFWELIKKHWIVENNNDYWLGVVTACDDLCKKYNNDLFVRKMLLGFIDYLEAQNNERKKQTN